MPETRINLKRLLEDIKEGYPFSIQEAIITELIANALDSEASTITFRPDPSFQQMTVIDNGKGMDRPSLEQYHDIAASTKRRGKRIGFAGLGAKLALLIGEKVITETKCNLFHAATEWTLQNEKRACYEFVPPRGFIHSASDTAVSIILSDATSPLLDDVFIQRVVKNHFYPLLNEQFLKILRDTYENGVAIFINDRKLNVRSITESASTKTFFVKIGRHRKLAPVGGGFLSKSASELPEEERGLAISTYGKVIKRGWDWVGLTPKNPSFVTGVVEIHKLADILTTNKTDFLKDPSSSQKYYEHRRAVQGAIVPILREFGEVSAPQQPV